MATVIRNLTLNRDGSMVVEYADDVDDVRSNGLVVNHIAYLPAEEYEDEIDRVVDAAFALVESIKADQMRLGPPESPERPDDEEDH